MFRELRSLAFWEFSWIFSPRGPPTLSVKKVVENGGHNASMKGRDRAQPRAHPRPPSGRENSTGQPVDQLQTQRLKRNIWRCRTAKTQRRENAPAREPRSPRQPKPRFRDSWGMCLWTDLIVCPSGVFWSLVFLKARFPCWFDHTEKLGFPRIRLFCDLPSVSKAKNHFSSSAFWNKKCRFLENLLV